MDDQWIYSSEPNPESVAAQLESLQRQQDALWSELRSEDDPDQRMALLSQFSQNRAAIDGLSETDETSDVPSPEPVLGYRVELSDNGANGKGAGGSDDGQALSFNDDGELVVEPDSTHTLELAIGQDPDQEPDPALDSGVEAAVDDADLEADRFDLLADLGLDVTFADDAESGFDDDSGDDLGDDSSDDLGDDSSDDPDDDLRDDSSDDLADDPDERGELPQIGDGLDLPLNLRSVDDDPAFSRTPAPTSEHAALIHRRADPRPPGPRPTPVRPADSRPAAPPPIGPRSRGPRPQSSSPASSQAVADAPRSESLVRILAIVGGSVALVLVAWLVLSRLASDDSTNVASDETTDAVVDAPAGPTADSGLEDMADALRNGGFEGLSVDQSDGVILLSGTVATNGDRDRAIGIVGAMAPGATLDASALVSAEVDGVRAGAVDGQNGRAAALQSELRRVVAATPIIFGSSETAITDLHARILNSIASIMLAYPEVPVTVVGFTDDTGSDSSNRQISLARAEGVVAYLVAQGVPEGNLLTDAQGEDTSTGSSSLANLERRVEFVVALPGEGELAPGASEVPIRVAMVAPSARNDLAFTQSMADALDVVAFERGNMEVAITDNTFVPEEAAAAIRSYADQGYDLVIAHGSQFGAVVAEVAPQYPDVVFAWGTASDTFGLQNVYAYDARSEQGGYVQGTLAGLLTTTGVIGVVGPIEVGDAQLYVDGFRAGALDSRADANLAVTYTGSFSDLTLAAETARSHVAAGADVMTGSAQMVVGAVSVANENGTLWFGTQANQASLAPSLVVASQVYHWEVILRPIIADIDAGAVAGGMRSADLANGGLVIEYNPESAIPVEVRSRGDETVAAIVDGSIVVPAG